MGPIGSNSFEDRADVVGISFKSYTLVTYKYYSLLIVIVKFVRATKRTQFVHNFQSCVIVDGFRGGGIAGLEFREVFWQKIFLFKIEKKRKKSFYVGIPAYFAKNKASLRILLCFAASNRKIVKLMNQHFFFFFFKNKNVKLRRKQIGSFVYRLYYKKKPSCRLHFGSECKWKVRQCALHFLSVYSTFHVSR